MTGVELSAAGISRQFGGVHALRDVSVTLLQATITGIIGPNGAGKTTLVNVISGQIRPDRGTVMLGGVDITRLAPERRFELGLARTFQGLRLYAGLTCYENLLAGDLRRGVKPALRERKARELLDQLGLVDDSASLPRNMPFGKQKLTAIGRTLLAEPRVILLDEPFAGLTDAETADLGGTLRRLVAADRATVLVIEHNLEALSEVAEVMIALDNGSVIAEGRPRDVLDHDRVRSAYFGGHTRAAVAEVLGAPP